MSNVARLTAERSHRRRHLLILGMEWFPDARGGSFRYVRELHKALRTGPFVASVVVVGPAHGACGDVVVPTSSRTPLLLRVFHYSRAALRLRRHADLIDVHAPLYAFVPLMLRAPRRAPVVVHFHGPWSEESRIAHDESRGRARLKRFVERSVYARADRMIVLSEAFRRLLAETYAVPAERIDVIPPGVDLAHFHPRCRAAARAELRIPSDVWMAVAVRRLTPRTGVHFLLQAWADLGLDSRKAVLAIAGDGSERRSLEAAAASLGISEAVTFLGDIDDATLVAHYQAADVSIVPSLALEGFGLVTLESLACGTPVIATNCEGLSEAVGALDRSLLVPPGDVAALAQRLRSAITGSDPLPPPSACRAYAERFGWDQVAARHETIYDSLLSRSR